MNLAVLEVPQAFFEGTLCITLCSQEISQEPHKMCPHRRSSDRTLIKFPYAKIWQVKHNIHELPVIRKNIIIWNLTSHIYDYFYADGEYLSNYLSYQTYLHFTLVYSQPAP